MWSEGILRRKPRRVLAGVFVLLFVAPVFGAFNIENEDVTWQYGYEADRLPGRAKIRFGRNSYPGRGELKLKNGLLVITTPGDGKTNQAGYLNMLRPEWTNKPAGTIQMRLRVVEQIPGTLYAGNLRARSDEKAFGIFFSRDKVALGSQSAPKVSAPIDATAFHVYRVTLEADAVKLYVDGGAKPVLVMKPQGGLKRPLIEFGAFNSSARFPPAGLGGTVEWDYIRWTQAGAFAPGTNEPAARSRIETPAEKFTGMKKRMSELASIADAQKRAAATVKLAAEMLKAKKGDLAVQLLRGIQGFAPDYAPAWEMLGFVRFDGRWVSKKSLPLWKSGKVKHTLRVMSFNILRDLRNHPRWLWSKRQPLVAAVINDYRPDLVGIQEVREDMTAPLMKLLPEYTPARMPCGAELRLGTYGGEFIYRTDRFELLGSEYYIFPPYDAVTGEYVGPGKKIVRRGGTLIRLRDKKTGRTVCAFSSHLAHSSRPMNLASCELMKKRITALPADAVVFVTGDFNISRGSPSWNVLATGERAMSDSRAHALQKGVSGNRNDGIDWLMFYPKELPVLFYAVIRYVEGEIRASDHDAVFAEFGLE